MPDSLIARNYIVQLPTIRLAMTEWGPESGIPVLMLHGWLDNVASFLPLVDDGQWLYQHNIRLIAADLAGHGYSGHRAEGQQYVFLDYVDDVHCLIQELELNNPVLLGHSMGGGIATIFAGTDVIQLSGLILIESLGPISHDPEQAPAQLTKHIIQRYRHQTQNITTYHDLLSIIKTRSKKSDLSENFVELIIHRNMKKVEGGYQWRSDPRLRIPSAIYLTHAQVNAFVANITCPTLLIYAEDGPWPNYPVLGERADLLQSKQMIALTGGHHLHMMNAEAVRNKIINYLIKSLY